MAMGSETGGAVHVDAGDLFIGREAFHHRRYDTDRMSIERQLFVQRCGDD
jgi:hypothetical protein